MVLYSYIPITSERVPLAPTLEEYALKSSPKNADARRAALSLLEKLSKASKVPVSFPICIAENGRPYFEAKGAPDFNLSHTGGLVAAVIGTCRVGIDIQEELSTLDTAKTAARFFSQAEKEALQNAPRTRFFELWTKKEALGKLLGEGLAPLLGKDTATLAAEHGVHFHTTRLFVNNKAYTLTICATEENLSFFSAFCQ